MVRGNGQVLEGWCYDVFLSFFGKDTRKNFTDHLYHALRDSGINTFRDDEELSKGGIICLELEEAIESSKILIIVFSKNYASSKWCLDELKHIVKSSKSNPRQLVFPIFHDVDPSNIRRQNGSVAESFYKHENHYSLDEIQSWRDALTATADLSGWDLRDRHEAECIKEIVKEILKKLDQSYLHVASCPVGLGPCVQRIGQLLDISSNNVQVVGICGMGGIGKTTIAKAAYNEFSHHFEGKSFLADFREYSKKPEGKIHLLQQLHSDILKKRDIEFNSTDHLAHEVLRQKRVLVVIDDVEDLEQFSSVAIDFSWFGPGSRIIVTTRNTHLLLQVGANRIYFPRGLNAGESLELLSWHAFRTREPPEEFLGLSRNVVEYCGGLPLAIEVLGAFLFKRNVTEWEGTLELLKRTPNDRIQEKLRISFDALSSVNKDIFLDTACFFIGMDKDYVSQVLDGCGFYPGVGLSVLMERCLVTVYHNKLMMHDLIRDMGREIVKKENLKSRGKRSRLWDVDDVMDVLTKYSGTGAVEALSLKVEGQELDAKSFSTLRELRFLQLSHVQLEGSYDHFPKGLLSLCWYGFPSESIPANFCLRSLGFMDMQYSNLRWFWKAQEAQYLKKLKFLDLSHSFWLKETPDFSYLPKLEKLLLIGCKSLVFVHKSIGTHCDKLVLVNLKDCVKLKELPADIYKLKSLITLVLSGCSKLKRLDDALGEMESLEALFVDDTAIRGMPSSVIRLKKLKDLRVCGGKGSWNNYVHSGKSPQPVLCFPSSSQSLNCLTSLSLTYCNLFDELIPKDFGSLPCVKELYLRGNSFRNLQTEFASLPVLRALLLSDCSKHQTMLGLPRTLWYLEAFSCALFKRTPDLSEYFYPSFLDLTNCIGLIETPRLDTLKQPMHIQMDMCRCRVDTLTESIIHGLDVVGYRGIYSGENRLPIWSGMENEAEFSLSFTVPGNPDLVLTESNLYIRGITESDSNLFHPKIRVTNHTKGSSWYGVQRAVVTFSWLNRKIVCARYILDESFLEKEDQVEVGMLFHPDAIIFEVGLFLSEANVVNAGSLLRVAFAFFNPQNDEDRKMGLFLGILLGILLLGFMTFISLRYQEAKVV